MSVPPSSKWVAKLCRIVPEARHRHDVWGDTFFLTSAKSQAAPKARLNWRVEIGSMRLRPGKSQPAGRASR